MAAAAIVGGMTIGGYHLWQDMTTHESTDDAYTQGHIHPISARVNGTVKNVLVDDNQHVKAGQLLVVLDPNDFNVRIEQAMAALKVAQHQAEAAKRSIALASTTADGKTTESTGNVANAAATITKAQAALVEAQAGVPAARNVLEQRKAEESLADVDLGRFQALADKGAVSKQERDTKFRDFQVAHQARMAAEEAVRQAVARTDQAQEAISVARAQLVQSKGTVQQAQAMHVQTQVNTSDYEVAVSAISQAQAQLDDAKLQLSYTKIASPIDGRVGKKTVEEGQRIQPGQEMMSIVSDQVWVTANFKETQLERMRPGQPATVKIDSFPHHIFTGKVDSVSPGSGATFALLPPENATGNFTKIVQRVPVKIVLDKDSVKGYENLVVPGMSVVASVTVSH